ncbi:MAG: hypothetical protein ACYC3I_10255 [Gemmataceae bacterium]
MAFFVHIEDKDQAYLDGLSLSDEAKGRLDDFINYAIANVDDSVRTDPAHRPFPNAPIFQLDFLILDSWGDRRFHKITFYVSDERAAVGVLLIEFMDHE